MTDWISGDGAGSIADMIAQTASEVMAENYLPGYIYIEQYQAYYNQETQCYYYPQNGLFYDMNKKCYLQYNQRYGKYEPIREKKKKAMWSKKRNKRKSIENFGNKAVEKMDQDGIDVVETIFDLIDQVCFLAGDDEDILRRQDKKFGAANVQNDVDLDNWMGPSRRRNDQNYSDGSDAETDEDAECERRRIEEQEAKNPPCLRIIELHNAFNFHIVTIDGAVVGCARQCTVQLPDEGAIDEEHCTISYDYAADSTPDIPKKCFWITNCSRHAILVNDTVVTRKKAADINHGDLMLIGDNKLSIHIHKGMNTCNECEPGILAKEAATLAVQSKQVVRTRETSRRDILNSLKRKYGLERPTPVANDNDYNDRAKVRRKTVGSEIDLPKSRTLGGQGGIYEGCAAAPIPGASIDTVELKVKPKKVEVPITQENKGFKLLKSMGWSEGKGLGKGEQGTVQTIATSIKADRTGLGHEDPAAKAKQKPMSYKERLYEKTKNRYQELDRPE